MTWEMEALLHRTGETVPVGRVCEEAGYAGREAYLRQRVRWLAKAHGGDTLPEGDRISVGSVPRSYPTKRHGYR